MSAITLAMGQDRGLYLDRFGNIATKVDEEAMADLLTQRLSSLVGEFRFDKPRGLPYMETVFANGTDGITPYRAAMLKAIRAEQHVISVAYLDMSVVGTELIFECGVVTEYGKIVLRSQE